MNKLVKSEIRTISFFFVLFSYNTSSVIGLLKISTVFLAFDCVSTNALTCFETSSCS